jgi:hypothetical protein
MSNKLTMRALDKVERRLSVKVETSVKIEKRAKAAGIAPATMMNAILDEAVAGDPWTAEDEARAREIIDANFKKRESDKARKGIK